jgi:macrodomain Ter protein organizer (MatP/YcbG family)
MIEAMCNEILGNYTKKEDQLMTAAFGTRRKRRLNQVLDALNFEYPDYERLSKGATNLESTLSDIDRILLDMAAEEAAAAAKEIMATVPEKGKAVAEDTSKKKASIFKI